MISSFRRTGQPGQDLDGLERHQSPDCARHATQNTLLLACRSTGLALRDSRPHAAVARPMLPEVVHGKLTVEAEGRARDERLTGDNTCVRDEVAGERLVGAVEDEVMG